MKKLMNLLISLTAIFFLAACGGSSDNGDNLDNGGDTLKLIN